MSPRIPRVPQPLRDWRVVTGIGLVIGAILAVVFVGIPAATSNSTPSDARTPVATPQTPVPTPVNPDQMELDRLRNTAGSGYNCPVNNSVKKLDQLRLCPNYTASVKFNPQKPTAHPVVTMPQTSSGLTPIVVSVEYIRSCGNDGVKDMPITCGDLWRVRWTTNTQFVALGYNTESVDVIRGDGSHWTGPIGQYNSDGDMLVSPTDTKSLEIYAGDINITTPAAPLSPERDSQIFDETPPTTDQPVMTV